jgi:flagellin-like hook-associated protein FlgL
MMGKTQERLATGLKVNSAMDNPTNFFTASGLKSRASDLGLLMDSVSNAVQTLAAADKGISAISKLVESAQATARQALQTSATVPVAATVTGDTYVANGASNGPVTFDLNGTAISIAEDDTITDAIAAINAQTGATGVVASEGTGADAGKIVLTANDTSTSIVVANLDFGTGDFEGIAEDTTAPTTDPNPKRAELVEQYNELLTQINDLAKDASFNGVNLLNDDDLQVIFNEDGSSKLDIQGVNFDAAGLGLTELDADAFDTNADINDVLATLKSGVETLRTQASKFGSNLQVVETRQNFTKDMVNVLETGAANLTLADTNEEAANLLALQTRQQLASTALSMASQADQAVLRLF